MNVAVHFHDAIKAKTIKLDGDDLLNYSEFVTQYKEADPGAFVQEKQEPDPKPDPKPDPDPQPQPTIVLPGKSTPPKKKKSLSEMMKAKNANPNLRIDWD